MEMRRLHLLLAVVFLSMAVSSAPALAATLPNPVGYVNDFAHVLGDTLPLEQELAGYDGQTGVQMVVVTIPDLPPDETAATYSTELFQQWGIGHKGVDDGILVLLVPNGTTGNRLRIELGYGMQGYITGAESGRILDQALPYYDGGNYSAAVRTIVDGLYAQLGSYQGSGDGSNAYTTTGVYDLLSQNALPIAFLVLFVTVPLITSRQKCPDCGSRDLDCRDDYCVCRKCGRRFKRKGRGFFFLPLFFGGGGGGGGFGGFGGGGSGGGGAGR